MTDLNALKKTKAKGKGDLPERGEKAPKVIADDPREKEEKSKKKKPLQLSISEEEFNDFSSKAAAMFGHVKGAKSKYFSHLLSKT